MTRQQARLFAIVSSTVVTIAFLAMTVDTHRQIPRLTNEDKLTPQVLAGKHVWHKFNCTNCHTLLGEGAYYAPDLTKIAIQRGPEYIRAFMHDPSRFYDEQKVRRVMPKQNISDQEITDLIAFLDWIGHIDTQNWPPRRILVSGAAIPGTDTGQAAAAPASNEPVALGQALFNATPPGCSACHSISPGVNLVGPTLANMGTRAAQAIKDPNYHGSAKDVEGYIRESIVNPNAYVVPGPTFSADGHSIMPGNFAKDLKPEQIDHLVAYLASLK
ncbi:MAG TPA: c-type cytochrome [Rhodocyclaceae bacterium]|nr:c-type cytochrome [Rhodocyclaceae bacterium]